MYERGKFGIEYNPRASGSSFGRPAWDTPWRWWPWLLGVVALATLVSFCHTVIKRITDSGQRITDRGERIEDRGERIEDRGGASAGAQFEGSKKSFSSCREALQAEASPVAGKPLENREAGGGVGGGVGDNKPTTTSGIGGSGDNKPTTTSAPTVVVDTRRPARVSTLLMRLDEAKRRRNDALAASTIELLLALPGNPVADLEDKLRRELGNLNLAALFNRKSAKWVADVTVKRGDAAERIAREYGSTYASLVKLNGSTTLSKLRPGQILKVMNHPRFNLVVHRRMRIADLELDGKFFRRYDLQGDVAAKPGVYEVPERLRTFFGTQGISLRAADRAELELLVPKGASVLVSEL